MSNLPPGCNLSRDPGQYDPPSTVYLCNGTPHPYTDYTYEKLADEHGEDAITVGDWVL